MSSSERNVLKDVAPTMKSVLKIVLPEQIYFNEETEEDTKSKAGPHQGGVPYSV